jgi:hypothetical protein
MEWNMSWLRELPGVVPFIMKVYRFIIALSLASLVIINKLNCITLFFSTSWRPRANDTFLWASPEATSKTWVG